MTCRRTPNLEFQTQRAYGVRLAGCDTIVEAYLFLVRPGIGIHLHMGIHVALVQHGQLQLLCRGIHECGVENYRSLPQSAQPPVVPLCCVASRKIVCAELQFCETEHFVVRELAEIVCQLRCLYVGTVGQSHLHVIEQHLPVRDMTCGAAGAHGNCNYEPGDYRSDYISHNNLQS